MEQRLESRIKERAHTEIRAECVQSNGRGSMQDYAVYINGIKHSDHILQYDRETEPDYPWFFARVRNGRLTSSANTICFVEKNDALFYLLRYLRGDEESPC